MAAGKPPPKKKPGGEASNPISKPAAVLPVNPMAKPAAAAPSPKPQAASPQPKPALSPVLQQPQRAQSKPQALQTIDPNSISDDEVEKKAFAILGIAAPERIQEPVIFRDFIEKLAPKIQLAGTSRSILQAFSSPDVTAEKIAQCIRANPYYEYQFLKVIESMSRREELPKLEGAIVMLGMQNSRNMILAMQLLRATRRTHPEWSKEGKLKLVPKEVLKYALKAEESLSGVKDSYPEMAYAGGMLYDLLMILTTDMAANVKEVSAYLDNVYSHGLRAAKLGMEMSKKLPDFAFKKYAFSASLIHDIGKVAMAILEPTYLDFVDDCAKRELPRAVRSFVEQGRYGISHQVLSGMICHYFRPFRPIEKAILYHHDPYLLKDSRNLFQISSMVALSTNVANHFKKTDKQDDPMVQRWKSMELRDFRFDIKDVMAAVQKLS